MRASDFTSRSGVAVEPTLASAAAAHSTGFAGKPFDQCRLLIVKLSAFGDVLQTFAVVTDLLRAGFKHIDWAVDERFAAVARLDTRINRVIAVPLKRWQRQGVLKGSTLGEVRAWRRELRSIDYDIVLDLQGLLKSAAVGRLARARWRLGYARPLCGEPAASYFYDRTAAFDDRGCDGAARLRTLASKLLAYPISDTPTYGVTITAPAGQALSEVYLVPGASKAEKQWDETSWLLLAQALIDRGYRLAFIWGADDELALAQRIIAGLSSQQQGAARVQARIPLAEYPSILGSAQAVIGVDTGMMHLASLLGVPSVVIFTSTLATTLVPEAGAPATAVGDVDAPPTHQQVLASFERVMACANASHADGSGYHRAIDDSDDHHESVAANCATASTVRSTKPGQDDSPQAQRLPNYA